MAKQDHQHDDSSDTAPGWDAISKVLDRLYGGVEPYHVGTVIPYYLGGPDPIHGMSAYKNLEPTPHWHIVTYGFSELWEKSWKDPKVSGYGFELTFRLACKASDKKPPMWAFSFLQNLARYVFETNNKFGSGHTLPCNSPLKLGSKTKLDCATFIHDPRLPKIKTPNGSVEFLQVVGITTDELDAITFWNAERFLKLWAKTDPLLITDLKRKSWLTDKSFAGKVAKLSRKEGSSCAFLALESRFQESKVGYILHFQSIAVDSFLNRLISRLPYGRDLSLCGEKQDIHFVPGKKTKVRVDKDSLTITLTPQQVEALHQNMPRHACQYAIPGLDNVRFKIARTEVTDADGKVVDVIE